jgi:hypothetical protein
VTDPAHWPAMIDWLKQHIALAALVISILALLLTLYRDVLLRPKIVYSVAELTDYPTSAPGAERLSLAVTRSEIGKPVALKHGVRVLIRSLGWAAASDVELKVRVEGGAVIVQVHTDDALIAENIPDIGKQGSPQVFIPLRRMVPREEVTFTFWYGMPDAPDAKPKLPTVRVRHANALGVQVKP